MMRRFFIAIVAMLCAALAGTAMAAPQRLALVIGNDTYESLPVLKKARNDAQAVADTLGGMGFGVTLLTDADRRSMTRAVSDLATAIQPGDEVMFYYAGHGVEILGRNYLLPADAPAARPGDEAFLTAESLAVDEVMDTLQTRGARVTVMILDACRDNPFPKDGTRSTGGTRGLAPVVAPEGAFILFSAGAGQTALDTLGEGDSDPNSVFTRALLPLLKTPGKPLQDLARDLKSEVEATAARVKHKQRPAYYDELTGDFLLVPAGAEAPLPATEVAPADTSACTKAARDWAAVSALNDPAVLRAFATTHAACDALALAATDRALQLSAPPADPAQQSVTYKDGSRYVGELKDGDPHGFGFMTFADGGTYEGEWRNGDVHGQGKSVEPDGYVYVGSYVDGKRSGTGTISHPENGTYTGAFSNDKQNGKGRYEWPDGAVYEGDWVDDRIEGRGVFAFADGAVYEGDYLADKRHGQGTYTVPNQYTYTGGWIEDAESGLGRAEYADGTVYVGEFRNGEPEGQGSMTGPDGSVDSGLWKAGELVQAAIVAPPAKTAPKAPTSWRVKGNVSDGYLNARSGPGTMHDILFRVNAGTSGMTVLECRPPDPGGGRFDWCRVDLQGNVAWVSKNGIEPE